MAKILLFTPVCSDLYNKLGNDHFSIHLGLAYIASFLEKNGHKVRLVDMQTSAYSPNTLRKLIRYENPLFVGITCTTPLVVKAKKIASIIKQINPKITIVFGGSHPSAVPKEVLKDKNVGIVVIGEGEHTFLELVRGYSLNNIKGIAYRKNGRIIVSPPRLLVEDLDSFPFPSYHLVNTRDYKGLIYRKETFGIIGSRGCPYNCIFCADHVVHQKKVRLRSPKNIIDEIEYLYKKHGIKNFVLYDELFTVYKQRAVSICKEIKKRRLNIQWTCSSRVDTVDENLLRLMKGSGCEGICYGIESGDQKILDIIQKGITIKQIEDGVNTAHRVGLKVIGLFIIGHPYETEGTIKKTIDLAKKLPFYGAIFTTVVPFPGTKLWDVVREGKGLRLLTKDYSKFKIQGKPVIELPTVSVKKLEEYHKKAYRHFYFRPSYIFWRLRKTRMKDFWFDAKQAFNLLNFTK